MNQHAKRRHQMGLFADEPAAEPPAPRPAPPPVAAGLHAFAVGAEHAGQRLDKLIAENMPGLSRTRVKALIEAGWVTLGGVAARDGAAKIAAGQTIGIEVPEAAPAAPAGENIPLKVVFEDAHLIVIDKPAGLVVHPSAGHETGTLVNALIAHCGDTLSGVGGVKRPGIVHRLDKDTTGLLVVAKTDAAHQGLAALFADHGRTMPFEREYIAYVWGAPDRHRGVIDAPLGRHPAHREKQAVVRSEKGREAVTHFTVEEAFGADHNGRPLAARVRCALETGRTHQIRVHLAHIGCPLLGDELYGAGFRTKVAKLPEKTRAAVGALRRQALHAAVLAFEHPVTGKPMRFESPPPKDMATLEKALRRS